jgi:thiamine biosynthesis protein ThiS
MSPPVPVVEIRINGEPRTVPSGLTLAGLLAELRLGARYVAVERNLSVVPRTQHAECILQPGDELEIVTLVGGG